MRTRANKNTCYVSIVFNYLTFKIPYAFRRFNLSSGVKYQLSDCMADIVVVVIGNAVGNAVVISSQK